MISLRSKKTPDKSVKRNSPPCIKEVDSKEKKEKKRIKKELTKQKINDSKGNGSYFWNNQLH